ncbi:MAG: hypothetical protein ACXV5N_12245 [Halobacteriota archaeon]
MTTVFGTLFVSAYGEEFVEPDECKIKVEIKCERIRIEDAQKASAEAFEATKQALSATNIENEIETTFF